MKQIHSARHWSQGDADWADLGAPLVSGSKGRKQHQKKVIYVAARAIMCWLSFLQGGRGKRIAVVCSFSLLMQERSTDRNVMVQTGTNLPVNQCSWLIRGSLPGASRKEWQSETILTHRWVLCFIQCHPVLRGQVAAVTAQLLQGF